MVGILDLKTILLSLKNKKTQDKDLNILIFLVVHDQSHNRNKQLILLHVM